MPAITNFSLFTWYALHIAHFIRLFQTIFFSLFLFSAVFHSMFFRLLYFCCLLFVVFMLHHYFLPLNLTKFVCSLLFSWSVVVVVCFVCCEPILSSHEHFYVSDVTTIHIVKRHRNCFLCTRKSHSMTLFYLLLETIIWLTAERRVLLLDFGTVDVEIRGVCTA